MQKPSQAPNPPVAESTYLLTIGHANTKQEIKATRIGVNESGALLIMKQNPVSGRHDPVRILASGCWNGIELVESPVK